MSVAVRQGAGRRERSAPPSRAGGRRLRLAARGRRELWLLVVPAAVFFAVFFVYPLVFGAHMSTTDYGTRTFITGEAPFVGTANFAEVLAGGRVGTAIRNTLVITVGSVSLQLVLGLAIALLFDRRFPGSRWMPTLLLIPWLIPTVVVALTWRWLLQGDGAINQVLGLLGVNGPAWLAGSGTALVAVVVVSVWGGLPFWVTILGAALKQVPREQIEAAQLDGAGALKRLVHIVVPGIWPVVSVLVILGIVHTLKIVDLVLVLTGGGPADGTVTLGLLAYQSAFELFRFGQGAAYGMLLLGVTVVIALLYAWLTGRQEKEQFG